MRLKTLPSALPNRENRHLDYLDSKGMEYHTLVVEHELTEDETQKLIARCKQESCTVGTALHAAFNAAVTEQLINKPADSVENKEKFIYSAVNVDLRRLTPLALPGYRDVEAIATGFYGGFTLISPDKVDTFVPILEDRSNLWPLAAELKTRFGDMFKRGDHLYVTPMLGKIFNRNVRYIWVTI